MNRSTQLIAIFAAMSLSSAARAEDESLGREGSVSLRTTIPVFTYEGLKPATGDSTSRIVVGPNLAVNGFAVDYWVTKDVTLGGALQYGSGEAGKDSSRLTIAPVVGYRFAVGGGTLWPKLQPYYVTATTKVASTDVKGSIFGVAGEVPYLWQRGTCFYGPALTFRSDFSSKVDNNGASSDGEKVTSVGLALEVGGTF